MHGGSDSGSTGLTKAPSRRGSMLLSSRQASFRNAAPGSEASTPSVRSFASRRGSLNIQVAAIQVEALPLSSLNRRGRVLMVEASPLSSRLSNEQPEAFRVGGTPVEKDKKMTQPSGRYVDVVGGAPHAGRERRGSAFGVAPMVTVPSARSTDDPTVTPRLLRISSMSGSTRTMSNRSLTTQPTDAGPLPRPPSLPRAPSLARTPSQRSLHGTPRSSDRALVRQPSLGRTQSSPPASMLPAAAARGPTEPWTPNPVQVAATAAGSRRDLSDMRARRSSRALLAVEPEKAETSLRVAVRRDVSAGDAFVTNPTMIRPTSFAQQMRRVASAGPQRPQRTRMTAVLPTPGSQRHLKISPHINPL